MLENWKSHIFLCAHIILVLLSTFFTSCWLWWSHASTKQNKSKQGWPRNSSYKLHKSECSTYILHVPPGKTDLHTCLLTVTAGQPGISALCSAMQRSNSCACRDSNVSSTKILQTLHLANCFCFFNFQPNHPPKTGDFFFSLHLNLFQLPPCSHGACTSPGLREWVNDDSWGDQ